MKSAKGVVIHQSFDFELFQISFAIESMFEGVVRQKYGGGNKNCRKLCLGA